MVARVVRSMVESYAARLRERFGGRLRSVQVFGSYARGEAHEESDADVLVLVDGLTPAEKVAAVELASEPTWDLGISLSPVVMRPDELEAQLRAGSGFARTVMEEASAP